jgi:uncharacterized protein YecE (DUF72 family)
MGNFMTEIASPSPFVAIGTAGWSIPKLSAAQVPGEGTHLQRYGKALQVTEINSSFYRPHRRATYERWAASVPSHFRFAVKVPKAITHERRLVGCEDLLATFADEVAGLGEKRGPSLVQLPPSLFFDSEVAHAFFAAVVASLGPQIVCEPRHASWFDPAVNDLLAEWRVARVAADPAVTPQAARPGGWDGLVYSRLHGSPAVYRSAYDEPFLQQQRDIIVAARDRGAECWTIFDNTASGAALPNALRLAEMVARA